MKIKLLIAFFCLLSFRLLMAQGGYMASYKLVYREDSLSQDKDSCDFYLLVDQQKHELQFFNAEFLANDSLNRTKPFNEKRNILVDFPIKIQRSTKDQVYTEYLAHLLDYFKINEKVNLHWNLTSENKKIGEWDSQGATTTFKGREWEAYFTSEIPLFYGPFKFYALPGLITEIHDKTNSYRFTLTGIRKLQRIPDTSEFMEKGNGLQKALTITWKDWRRIKENRYKDPFAFTRDPLFTNPPSPADIQRMTKEKQREMRQNNNPIELSEAPVYK